MKRIPAVPRKTPRTEEAGKGIAEISAMALIRVERQRQIETEGWTPAHDDSHTDGELAAAARCYWRFDTTAAVPLREDGVPNDWPWDAAWWKPKDRLSNLVRAGALLTAEIERLKRASIEAGNRMTPRQRDIAFETLILGIQRERDHVIQLIEPDYIAPRISLS